MKKIALVLTLLVTASLFLAGCAVANAATPKPTDPLVDVHAEGGLCVSGTVCATDIHVLQNGTYTVQNGSGQPTSGLLDAASLTQLKAAIDAADFNAIRSKPFTGTCPIAFDGQEYTYTFHRGGATEVVDSCKHELDMESILFKVDYQ